MRNVIAASLIMGFVGNICGQGTFQNLDFSAANPVRDPNSYDGLGYTTASTLPDWTVYMGTEQWPYVIWNLLTTGQAAVSLLGPGSGAGTFPIGGNYSVEITAGAIPLGSEAVDVSIAQTGIIPQNAQSLQFYESPSHSPLAVTFNGTVLPMYIVSSPSGQPYSIYAADISSYAGQSGQLEFTSVGNGGFNPVELGGISFSPSAVPEPVPSVLCGVGCLAFLFYRQMMSTKLGHV